MGDGRIIGDTSVHQRSTRDNDGREDGRDGRAREDGIDVGAPRQHDLGALKNIGGHHVHRRFRVFELAQGQVLGDEAP